MAISRKKKEELVAGYLKELKDSEAIIITDYRGLSVTQLEQLRIKIRDAEGSYSVVKNSLAQIALEEAGLPTPDEMFIGPVGIGFCHQNIPGVAKAITTFVKENDEMKVKGGLMGAEIVDEATIKALAELPSLEVLRAQLLGLLNAPATQLTGVIAGGVRQVMNVLNAYAEKDKEEASAEES